jgi:hypothetical protein
MSLEYVAHHPLWRHATAAEFKVQLPWTWIAPRTEEVCAAGISHTQQLFRAAASLPRLTHLLAHLPFYDRVMDSPEVAAATAELTAALGPRLRSATLAAMPLSFVRSLVNMRHLELKVFDSEGNGSERKGGELTDELSGMVHLESLMLGVERVNASLAASLRTLTVQHSLRELHVFWRGMAPKDQSGVHHLVAALTGTESPRQSNHAAAAATADDSAATASSTADTSSDSSAGPAVPLEVLSLYGIPAGVFDNWYNVLLLPALRELTLVWSSDLNSSDVVCDAPSGSVSDAPPPAAASLRSLSLRGPLHPSSQDAPTTHRLRMLETIDLVIPTQPGPFLG